MRVGAAEGANAAASLSGEDDGMVAWVVACLRLREVMRCRHSVQIGRIRGCSIMQSSQELYETPVTMRMDFNRLTWYALNGYKSR